MSTGRPGYQEAKDGGLEVSTDRVDVLLAAPKFGAPCFKLGGRRFFASLKGRSFREPVEFAVGLRN